MVEYTIIYTKAYKKSIKKIDSKSLILVEEVIGKLSRNEILEPKHKDHQLKGYYKDFRECHIKPNLLLIYQKDDDKLILRAVNLGSHSELF